MIEGLFLENWGAFPPSRWQQWLIEQSNRHQKGIWPSLCRRLVSFRLRHPLDVVALGAKLRLYPVGNLCEKRVLFTEADFDPGELEQLAKRIHPGFKFVDIGANIGLYSLFVAAQAGPKAKILAVEPQPQIKQRLKFNLSNNQPHQISHVDCAVADKKGMARMGISRRNRGASGFALRSGKTPDDEFVVQTRALAELLESFGMTGADALKMDIEGAEELVLPRFFADTKRADLPKMLLLENNSGWKIDCIALAEEHGYTRTLTTKRNVVLEQDL
ncbi:hypothetical protein MNBD_ALPHA06-1972 [hydrothermal vent metagenome]|uniref:Methyltransferase FkbM domain-containing protein n=1 Tax=hydrothermal vent metagenome TaxID=652676 RepID=A0A3B0T1G9_9ZZZZ